MSDGNRERNDYRQGYHKGFTWGFWSGCAIATIGTIVMLYLIGLYA